MLCCYQEVHHLSTKAVVCLVVVSVVLLGLICFCKRGKQK
uniref:4 kDa protein n=1 Tax=Grapevine leafroll-associated virus 3 TaxID=55951 RepID=A0A2R2Y3F3_9CLOS|nr:4 kDa protein [Grapevine leafroll-associated virus 3]